MQNLNLRNYGVQASIFLGFLLVGVIVLVVAFIGWNGTNRLGDSINVITTNAVPSLLSLTKVHQAQTAAVAAANAQASPDFSPAAKKEELENLKSALTRIQDGFADYEKLPSKQDEKSLYQAVGPTFDTLKKDIDEFLKLKEDFDRFNIENPRQVQIDLLSQNKAKGAEFNQAKDASQALKKMGDYTFITLRPAAQQSEAALLKLIDFSSKLEEQETQKTNQNVSETSRSALIWMILGPLVAIIFGTFFTRIVAGEIGGKIGRVVNVAEGIAAGDLTQELPPAQTRDEVGKLQEAFRTMSKNLNGLISEINQVGIKVTRSATQIAATGKQLEATVTEQAASTNQVSATSQQISATTGQLVKNVERLAEQAQATARSASQSQADLMTMATAMQQLAQATTSISGTLGVMNEKANNINTVVTTITKVADQTNLLSLNAAIEAEKAGEYGAGFAVVAREIRRLADQTAVATLEIEQMVKEMQSSVSTSVMEMDKFNREVGHHVQQVSKISEQIAEVIEQVQGLTPRFAEVSQSMEQQFQGAQQITTAIAQLNEASHQTVDSLRDTNRALSQLDEAAQGLQKIISQFKVRS